MPAFTPEVFFHFLLPPIILDSAYALYDDDFFENLGLILTFAFVGTFLNVIIVGASLFGLGAAGAMGDFVDDAPSFLNCLTFASLVTLTLTPERFRFSNICLLFAPQISAVDPVAVLAIFEEIGVNMVLYFLVFGESLLNDGVTIVFYNTFVALQHSDVNASQILLAIASLFTVVVGGLVIGLLIGALSALILKCTKVDQILHPLINLLFDFRTHCNVCRTEI